MKSGYRRRESALSRLAPGWLPSGNRKLAACLQYKYSSILWRRNAESSLLLAINNGNVSAIVANVISENLWRVNINVVTLSRKSENEERNEAI